ncbi:MAG: alpha-L-rhamnosidase C-terminal domain-containing protein [Mariniphaga sp.]
MKPRNLFLLFSLFLSPICHAEQQNPDSVTSIQSSMIWSTSIPDGKQAYVAFRKRFELSETSTSAKLQLFADSRYLLWINGKYVLRGPCRFNPKRPEYDVVDVHAYLKKGNNVIVVLAHNYGGAVNGHIMKHVPGLTAVLEIAGKEILHTDSTWRCNEHTRYLASPESWNTVPDVIDGRIDDAAWITSGFDDSAWQSAKPIDGNQWGRMYPRQIPLARETELNRLRILPTGKLLSTELPLELKAGEELLVDFGRMVQAYTSMDLEAESGSQISMQYALRYKNGIPDEMYGDGNHYTCRSGRQSFMTTDQWGSHYMLVKCTSGKVKLLGIKITDRSYPFDRIGNFRCSDGVLTNLWTMAQNTIEITSDDGYGSDARERNEWIQDAGKASFSTTRVGSAGPSKDGKPVYSDPRLLKNMLRHAAQSQLPNGQLLATFPTDRGPEDCHYIIDDYSCQWFEGLKIYYNVTGDKEFVREMWPILVAQINWFLKNRTERGLLLAREYTSFDNPFAYYTCEGATINAFFYSALKNCEELALIAGEMQKSIEFKNAAGDLKTAFNHQFWNDSELAYNSAFYQNRLYPPTVHAQLIALHYNLVPENRKASVEKWFLTNYKNQGMKHSCLNPDLEVMVNQKSGVEMPVVYFWVFSQLFRMDSEDLDREAIREMRRRWTSMVNFMQDAGTLCESFTDEKGEGASESCHNYGSVPAYFLSTNILGVQLDGAVWDKKLVIEPRLGDLSFAEGVVVTPHGAVPVSWKKSSDGKSLQYKITIPKGIHTMLHLPKLSDKATLTMNGKVLMKEGKPSPGTTIEGRWIVIPKLTGECSGSLK